MSVQGYNFVSAYREFLTELQFEQQKDPAFMCPKGKGMDILPPAACNFGRLWD